MFSRRNLMILLVIFICFANLSFANVINNAKLVVVIPSENFRDEELFSVKEMLEQAGVTVKIASSTLSHVKGMLGGSYTPEMLVTDINAKDFDGIVFIGGTGAVEYWNSIVAYQKINDFNAQNKLIAAICIAPVILANAGVLKSKNATVFPTEAERIESKGAKYTGSIVEIDGNIITADGPDSSKEFAFRILGWLKSNIKVYETQ